MPPLACRASPVWTLALIGAALALAGCAAMPKDPHYEARGEAPSPPRRSGEGDALSFPGVAALTAVPTVAASRTLRSTGDPGSDGSSEPAPQSGTRWSAPDPVATAARMRVELAEAIERADVAELDRLAGDGAVTVYLPGRASAVHVKQGAPGLASSWELPAAGHAQVTDAGLGPIDVRETLRGILRSGLEIRDVVYSRGWGEDGGDEAALVLTEDESGRVRLSHRILARAGFDAALRASVPPTRTYTLTPLSLPAEVYEIDVPGDWHRVAFFRVDSAPPWHRAEEGQGPRSPPLPEEPVRLTLAARDEPDSAFAGWPDTEDFLPGPRTAYFTETLRLGSGDPALLATALHGEEAVLRLHVGEARGSAVVATCWPRRAICDRVLRTLRWLGPGDGGG